MNVGGDDFFTFLYKVLIFFLIFLSLKYVIMNKFMTFSFLLVGLFSINKAVSQLYVSPNSFVYNKGELVYVKQDINLQNNGNFYLRNEGQLLQGTTGASTNQGQGKLSVFQEGTVNNYAYNYWCSPIGNASAATGNEDFGVTMLNVPTTSTASTPATMLAMNGYDGTSAAGSLAIAPYWIWRFLSSTTYAQWVQSGTTTNIAAGQGFTMKGTSGTDATNVGETAVNNPGSKQRYDFRGKPNDGNITVNVGLNSFTLTGNPYPSALHVNAFLLDPTNTACDATAYYWEQDKTVNSHVLVAYQGGYGTYAPGTLVSSGTYVPATFDTYTITGTLNTTGLSSGLTNIERKYAPIGQGFMIKGNSNGSVALKNSHRAYYKESTTANSYFERNNSTVQSPIDGGINTTPHLRLNISFNNQYTRQIALTFFPEATDGVDRGMDAKSPTDGSLPNDAYFFLDNDRYVIEGINFDIDKRVPLGLKVTNNTTFNFSLPEVINFDESQPVYIYDAADNSYHNLKQANYQVMLHTGVYNDRFEVTFKDSNTALAVDTNVASSFTIVQNNSNQLLSIANPNSLDVKSVALYDMAGKLMFDKVNLGAKATYEFSTSALSEAVYIVKLLTTDNKGLGQKIIVERVK